MEFRVLGPLEIAVDGAVLPLRAPGQRALLAGLLLSANQVVTTDRLADLLWGNQLPASASANLRSHVAAVRRLLSAADGRQRVVTRSGGYLIEITEGELDLSVFETLVRRGEQARRQGDPATAAARFSQALALWRGDLAEGVPATDGLESERIRLAERRLLTVTDLAATRLEMGQHRDLVGELRGLVLRYPMREELGALLMLALYRSGQQADALAAYDRLRTTLRDELGVDPGPDIRQLWQQILRNDPALDPEHFDPPVVTAPRRRAGTTTRLVGRDSELAALEAWLTEALDGTPRLVLCAGAPGIGKTRLTDELLAIAATRGVPAVSARLTDVEGAPPYWLWRQVIAAASALGDGTRAPADLAPLMPGPGPATTGDAAETRFRLFDAAGALLRDTSARAGLLVVIDDAHWADEPSILLLRHLATQLAGGRLLIVVTYRDTEPGVNEVVPELIREPVTERLALTGLATGAVAEQLAEVRGVPISPELADRVQKLTGGNPFFIGEVARLMTDDLPSGPPPSVRAAISRRLDRLSPQCRELLRVASILGSEFPVAVVAAISGEPALECLSLFDEAVAAGLLEQATASAARHRFVHALIRDAVEADLTSGERAELHRSAAEAIEACYAHDLGPHLSDLARHWADAAVAGERDRAAKWIEHAAQEAVRVLAYEEGARLFQLALRVGEHELDGLRRHGLLVELARALHASAAAADSLQACLTAAAIGRSLGRADLIGDAALAVECIGEPDFDRTLRSLCEEALAGLDPEPTGRRARLLALLADTGMYLSDFGGADSASRQALTAAELSGEPEVVVRALRARQLATSGPEGGAERSELTRRMLAAGKQLGSPSAQLWATLWHIDSCFEHGDLAGVAEAIGSLTWFSGQVGGPLARWHLLRVRAALAQAQGHFAEAALLGDQAFAAIVATRRATAYGSRNALRAMIDYHQGAEQDVPAGGAAPTPGPAHLILATLGPAFSLTTTGRLTDAGVLYSSLGSPALWRPAPYFRIPAYALGIVVAIGQDLQEDVAVLAERLAPYRGLHLGGGAGSANYSGPVELYLGKAAAFLGNLDTALVELETALDLCRHNGAVAHIVEILDNVTGVLLQRGRPADHTRTQTLAGEAARSAAALGMRSFAARLEQRRRG